MRVPRLQRRLAPTVGLLVALILSGPMPAQADIGQRIIRLCTTEKSLSGFPPSAYAKALKEISATTEEYSDCGQLIRQAQQAAALGHGGGSTGGALPQAVAATPAEQQAISSAPKTGSAPVNVGGQVIHPGVVHANVASAFSTLPTPLLVLLGFLLACLLVFGGVVLRNRVRDRSAD
ncbi:MAG: hypothetical protein ACLQBB_07025 [Solirubrobacteraceae bacterium]